MAIRHPKTRVASGQTMDPDLILYGAMRPFYEELTGGLNEQNFDTEALTEANRGAQIVDGAVYQIGHTVVDTADTLDPSNTPGTNIFIVPQTQQWIEVLGRNITMRRAGALWLLASCTVNSDRWAGVALTADQDGVFFALGVDGTPVPESGPASYEEANEHFSRDNTVPSTMGSLGVSRFAHPVRCSIVVPVPSGSMRVALLARSCSADIVHSIRVYTRQLLAIQMLGATIL